MSSEDPDRDIARELRLRAEPPPVVRLSRRAIALAAGVAAAAIAGVAGWALLDRSAGPPAPPPTPALEPQPPEGLAALPKDYASLPPDTPRLGPPLPGDLGRPILARTTGAGVGGAPADPAAEARRQALDQARASRLFAAVAAAARPPLGVEAPAAAPPPADEASPRLLAGSTLSAALVTGLRSDLPGPVVAQVTEDALDSLRGQVVIVPKGSRLLGAYDSKVAFGQSRLLVAWTRIVLPDGRSLMLEKEPAGDAAGRAGLQDRVERHWGQLLGASLVTLGVSAAAQLGQSGEDDLVRALRSGVSDTATQVGARVVGRSLDVAPTLTIRPGFPLRVLLTRDLAGEPANTPE